MNFATQLLQPYILMFTSLILLCNNFRILALLICLFALLKSGPQLLSPLKQRFIYTHPLFCSILLYLVVRNFNASTDYLDITNTLKVSFVAVLFFLAAFSLPVKAKNYLLILIPPFIYLLFSFLITLYVDPSLVLNRKIINFPILEEIEWGPTLVYYNMAAIMLLPVFIQKKNLKMICVSTLCLMASFIYGVRGAMLGFILAMIIYFINRTGQKLKIFAIMATTLVVLLALDAGWRSFFSNDQILHSAKIFRGLDSSPRAYMLKDTFTSHFAIENIWGGKKTEFTHPEVKINPHNFFIFNYWAYGIISALIFAFIVFLSLKKYKKLPNLLVTLSFIVTFSLNIFQTWYLVLFLVHIALLIKEEYETRKI